MQRQPDTGRQRLHHGASRKLVPESHYVSAHLQHAQLLGLGKRRDVIEQRTEQAELDARGHHGELLEARPRRSGQRVHPGQYRVDDCQRHPSTGSGECLCDEERVPAREPEQVGRVDGRVYGQSRDRTGSQPGQPQPDRLGATEGA
jgi:hypothetical protein